MSNIVIKISSDMSGSSVTENQNKTTSGQKTQQKLQQKSNNAGETSLLKDFTKVLFIEQGRKLLQNVINQFGNMTGNSVAQNRINAVTQGIGYATAIYAAGWVGAIGVAADIGIQAANSVFEQRKANAQIDLLRERVGSSTINGSRSSYD